MRKISFTLLLLIISLSVQFKGYAQNNEKGILLMADRVFDGNDLHTDWVVIVKGNKISYVGKAPKEQAGYKIIKLTNSTLLPGLIEGHSHILLHPYNETSWNEQVLNESDAERAARAVNHLKSNLMAGFTTIRDLGSEGAGYTDVGLRTALEKNVIQGPRLLVAGPAIVATGSYGPKGFHDRVKVPLGAEEADGHDDLIKTVRRQIGNGVDIVKVYADYRWGPNKTAQPTFTLEELKLIVEIATSSGRKVVAHAATAEGMRRATLAGVSTIEHGDGGTAEVFRLMKEYNVALCPTIAAGESISKYRGWKKGIDPDTERVLNKKKSVKLALEAGVEIVAGGDVGVFPHGENVLELELMVSYGMKTTEVLKSVTSVNAKRFELTQLGNIQKGFLADLIIVRGNPINEISSLRNILLVMKDGVIYKENQGLN